MSTTTYTPRPQVKYKEEIVAALKEEFGYKSIMQVPKLEKIVLSQGLGAATADKKIVDYAIEELELITGQKAVGTISKKAIGAKVTLRGEKMYEFLDRLVSAALPRVRDFSGISSTGFDGRGNYNLGIKEQIIFPEINIDKIKKIQGLDITFVTSANTDKEAKALLSKFGLPFTKEK